MKAEGCTALLVCVVSRNLFDVVASMLFPEFPIGWTAEAWEGVVCVALLLSSA